MKELLELKKKAEALGLCKECKSRWDDCEDKEDYVKMALDGKGVEFLCDGFQFKWGLKSKFIKDNFSEYINGKYLCVNPDGDSSELYCRFRGNVIVRSTVLVIIDCMADIEVPADVSVKIYIAGNSQVRIRAAGEVRIINYGTRTHIGRKFNAEKTVLASEWIKEKPLRR